MLYQLPTGKTIELSFEQFINMTDDDQQYLIARNYGDHVSNPFHHSVLKDLHDTVVDEIEGCALPEEELKELYLVEESEKFCESDFNTHDNDYDTNY